MDKELVSSRLLKPSDLKRLPDQVSKYIELCGWVGKPLPQNFYASSSGYSYNLSHKARSVKQEQYSFMTTEESRISRTNKIFFRERQRLDERGGFSLTKFMGLIKTQGFSGKEMAQTESVSYLCDLFLFAPGILPFVPIQWNVEDNLTVVATTSMFRQQFSVKLYFNDQGMLEEIKSNDCFVALDGKTLESVPWMVSLSDYAETNGISTPNRLVYTWLLRSGDYDYADLKVNSVEFNLNDSKFKKRKTI